MFRKLLLALLLAASVTPPAPTAAAPPPAFGVTAHGNVSIEWWYVNAHVTTTKGRHLALIASFFRFGNGASPLSPGQPAPRAHYLIYAITDLDRRAHCSYSLADTNMVTLLRQLAPLLALTSGRDAGMQALVTALNQGRLPAGNQNMSGPAVIQDTPFRLSYGDDSLTSTNAANTAFALSLGAEERDTIHLTLAAEKPPMAVGGNGDTGLTRPTDMHYFSLTRCRVGGTINTGSGPEVITGGEGWFDHQWGNSWVVQNDGWDWWGVQLGDGTDILFFRQRDLATGRIFFPLATFMDKNGRQSVTKNIVFTPDLHSLWTSPKTGVTYPLAWTVKFPGKGLTLHIGTMAPNQEMTILGPGGGIWEGTCDVSAVMLGQTAGPVRGVGYMELVGYNSPAVKAQLDKKIPIKKSSK